MDKQLNIYVDGACRGQGKRKGARNPGSWAFVVFKGWEKKGSKSGFLPATTNNEAELTAIVKALEWLDRAGVSAVIHTDSAYCCNGYSQWMVGWYRRGWKKADGKTPENLELWKRVLELSKMVDVRIEKVKGHAGNPGNEAADGLCNQILDDKEFNDHMR